MMSELNFAPPLVEREDLPDGAFILRSPVGLAPYPDTLCEHLIYWAQTCPDRTFLAQRGASGDWCRLSYSDALTQTRSIAQSLINRDIQPDRPVMILSENSIEHALIALAGYFAGIPTASISPPYALMSHDYGKLIHVFESLNPSMIYVSNGVNYARALTALDLDGIEVISTSNPSETMEMTPFETLVQTPATVQVDEVQATLTPETISKILFTSGSTGMPKGVINTHRMQCSNQQALAQIWPFLEEKPPVLVDWLPWSHTFGSNHNFNLVLRNGGTMYIDGGKPAPGLIETTVANLKDIAPTIYFNVPRGYDQLIPYLEADVEFRDHFFSRLDSLFYAAAALPQNLWERLEELSQAALGRKIAMTSAWGSTETAPLATGVHFPIERAGVMGLPVPECELKIVPAADKLEIRVRGPNVTPGYYRRPELTRKAFDEDGFYLIGDAVKLADPQDPTQGVIFDGRVAEDFKLLTGSWVSAGNIRVAAISAGDPIIQDVVVTGHDRNEIGLLVFPNIPALGRIAGLPGDTILPRLFANKAVRNALRNGLAQHNKVNPASSTRIARVLMMQEPPDQDKNEITDKGYINQIAVLANRTDLVEKLYTQDSEVLIIN